ncbi:MAG: FadR/GntR family transcriptional regulator [Faecousia sp.]
MAASATSLPKIKRDSLSNRIYDIIKDYIISGEWPVGTRIPSEPELAEQLGVSRASVRTAIQRLNALGLVDVRVGEGTFVTEFSVSNYLSELGEYVLRPKDMSDIADFRQVFEIGALKLAFERRTEEQINVLEGILRELLSAAEAGQEDAFLDADCRFHRYFCTMSGNSLFETLFDICSTLMLRNSKANHDTSQLPSDFDPEQEDHMILFRLFKEGKIDECIKHYSEMIDYSTMRS